MIKAIATNVTAINPKDNRHIVSNNIDSIIAPPPFLTEKTVYVSGSSTSDFLISYAKYYILLKIKKQANINKKFDKLNILLGGMPMYNLELYK